MDSAAVRFRGVLLAVLLAGLLGGCGRATPEPLTVFAAASLTEAVEALADAFEAARPGVDVRVNVAASSLLARQIAAGAPADVFFSASVAWMDVLVAEGHVAGAVARPVGNRLVVAGPAGAPDLASLADLARLERLALADPEAVPAGVYARQGLECAGLWAAVAPRVVPTLDVRAALLAVQHGAAAAAVVYASDLRVAEGVRAVLAWPDAAHPPIRYAVAAVVPGTEAAHAFVRFAADPARADLWRRYGFTPLAAADAAAGAAEGCRP